MAGRYEVDVEHVVELVLNGSEHEEDDENSNSESENGGQDVVKEKLIGVLDSFEGGATFHQNFFRESALEMLIPLVLVSCKELQETADMEAFRLL